MLLPLAVNTNSNAVVVVITLILFFSIKYKVIAMQGTIGMAGIRNMAWSWLGGRTKQQFHVQDHVGCRLT